MPARTKAYLFLLIAVAIWGLGGVVIKYTLGYFDPLLFLTYRFSLTTLVLVPIWLFVDRNRHHLFPQLSFYDWLILIVSGLLGTTLQLILLFEGFKYTTAIEGTLISSTAPILVAIAGVWWLKEHITTREKIGLILASIGSIIVVIGPGISGSVWGNLLVLLSNFAWVGYVILTKKQLRHQLSPLFITTFNFFVGFISMSIILFLKHGSLFLSQPFSAHLGVWYMALFSGALAYFLYQAGQKTIEASEADIFLYLQPIFATPISYFWLHEIITPFFIVGSIIIAAGVFLSEYKPNLQN